MADGRVYILMAAFGGEFPPRTGFIADDAVKREMLATALTALSIGDTVGAELESTAPNSRIIALHVGSSESNLQDASEWVERLSLTS